MYFCCVLPVSAVCTCDGKVNAYFFKFSFPQDMFTILLFGLAFVFWAFFSFFVHVLVAVFFPVVSGLLLGLWIYLWRNVKEFFHQLGMDPTQHVGTVYRKLPAGSGGGGGRSLMLT